MTPAIFVLLESKIYGVSAPNQGAFEGFTLRGDLLCVPPASNDAESSSNQVLQGAHIGRKKYMGSEFKLFQQYW